ncbi:MAG TPA: TonB-dependent receptor, partial [Gemmatimonadaceae bacterium]|nr:TonB-dependent receptor [Gemmatimonadaceae bacterium]
AAEGLGIYASYGINGREPTRNDMFAGFDNLDTTNVAFVGPLERVRPERVRDLETGVTYQNATLSAQANLFAMEFREEIAPIGELSYLGSPLRKNVGRSYRRGLELDATWRPAARLTLGGSATLMRARIAEYTDDATGETFRDVAPLLTPEVLVSHQGTVALTRELSAGVAGRYMGRSYLANTGDARFVLPSSYLLDGHVSWTRGRWGLAVHANNLSDANAYASGYTDGAASYYFVAPPRNVLVTAKLGF